MKLNNNKLIIESKFINDIEFHRYNGDSFKDKISAEKKALQFRKLGFYARILKSQHKKEGGAIKELWTLEEKFKVFWAKKPFTKNIKS